jgi:hypothetical protein
MEDINSCFKTFFNSPNTSLLSKALLMFSIIAGYVYFLAVIIKHTYL